MIRRIALAVLLLAATSLRADLASEIRRAAASGSTVWLTWNEPVADPDSQMCCFSSVEQGRKSGWRGGRCTLGSKGMNFSSGTIDNAPPRARTTFAIYARVEGGAVREIKMFSEDCQVDPAGAAVQRIAYVSPAESIAWLLAYAEDNTGSKKDAHQPAAAIAMHKDPAAVAALERLVRQAKSEDTRAAAAFWLGHSGGARGRAVLREVIDAPSTSHQMIDQALAGMAQDEDRAATDLLLTLAKTHREPQVRKQSLFWLGQRAGEKATKDLREATDDPDADVREMAVFSISQLPKERAVPELIELARTHKSKRVRERAIFWLGQSGDPRALQFIEEVLTN